MVHYFYLPIVHFHSAKFSKNSSSQSRVMRMCHFQAQNTPICPEKNFLVQTIIITFIYLLANFIGKNFRNSFSGSRVMRMCQFWTQNGPFAPQNFFWKIINITLIYLLAPFILTNFIKILPAGPDL